MKNHNVDKTGNKKSKTEAAWSICIAIIAIFLMASQAAGTLAFEVDSKGGILTVQSEDAIPHPGTNLSIEVATFAADTSYLSITTPSKLFKYTASLQDAANFTITEPGALRIDLIDMITKKSIDNLEIFVEETSTAEQAKQTAPNELPTPNPEDSQAERPVSAQSNTGIIKTDKAEYLLGETVIANVNTSSSQDTPVEVYYEYNGFSQKYMGDPSLIAFTPKGIGTHQLILRDLLGNELDNLAFHVKEPDSYGKIDNQSSAGLKNKTVNVDIQSLESYLGIINQENQSDPTEIEGKINVTSPDAAENGNPETQHEDGPANDAKLAQRLLQKKLDEQKITRQIKIIDTTGKRTSFEAKVFSKRNATKLGMANKLLQTLGQESYEDAYEVELTKPGSSDRIRINDLRVPAGGPIDLGLDDIDTGKMANLLPGKEIQKAMAINPQAVSFTTGSIITRAKGRELWKCKDWSFSSQVCQGSWEKIMDITPGREYAIPITPTDPAFVETGVATINTKRSTIKPNDPADLIAVVLDTRGYLVSGANVTITVTSPTGTTYSYTTQEGSITETSKGIYETRHVHTEEEGNYTVNVTAQFLEGSSFANSSMQAKFQAKQDFPFDIIRKMPATIDPWQGPFKATLEINPLNESISIYNVTEVIPPDVDVIDAQGAVVFDFENSTRIKWSDITDNSTLNYTAQAPLITPNVLTFGRVIIDYVIDGVLELFQEYNPWSMAVDPVPATNRGLVVYSDNNRNLIRSRNWTGSTLTAEQVTGITTGGDNSRWYKFRCMKSYPECLLLVSDDANDLYFAVYHTDTNLWSNYTTLSINTVSGTGAFDVECEDTSGRCLIAYENQTVNENSILWRTWNGTNISGPTTFNFSIALARPFNWLKLFPKRGSNFIGMGLQDNSNANPATSPSIYGAIWNGSNFTQMRLLTSNAANLGAGNTRTYNKEFDCAWDSQGYFYCIHGTNAQVWLNMSRYVGNGTHNWTSLGSIYGGSAREIQEVSICGVEPWSTFTHNYLGIMMCNDGEDMDGGMWNGTNFSKTTNTQTPGYNTGAECSGNKVADSRGQNFQCIWELTGDEALFTWVDTGEDWVTSASYTYSTNTWSIANFSAGSQISLNGANDLRTTLLVSNSESDEVFLTFSDGGTSDAACAYWSGNSWDSSGCNNSAVFETVDNDIDQFRWVVFDYFRSPVEPDIDIITPNSTTATLTFSGITSPSTTYQAYNGSWTADPPAAAAAPILGSAFTSNAYVNISASDNTRSVSLFSGTGSFAYQSFNFSVSQSTVSMSSLQITHEGYATRGTTPSADSFNIYYYNWNTDTYDLIRNVFATSVDVVTEDTITTGFTNYIRNKQMLVLVETDTVTAGGAANNAAAMYTDYIGLTIKNVPLITTTLRVNASAIDANGIDSCQWLLQNTTTNVTGYTNMTYTGGTLYFNLSTTPSVADGFYNVTVRCNDTNGDALNATTEIYIDNTPPAIALQYPANVSNFTRNHMYFGWNVTDIAFENMYCNVTMDGALAATNVLSVHGENTSYNKTSISDGTHWWNVTCGDNAGNSNTSINWKFDTDTGPPTVTASYPSLNAFINTTTTDLNFTAVDTHLANCTLRLDGGTNGTLYNITSGTKYNFTFTDLYEGIHRWNVSCMDTFGYIGNSSNMNFTLDRTQPSVYLNTTDGAVFNGTIPSLNYTAVDNLDPTLTCNLTVNNIVVVTNIPSPTGQLRNINVSLTDGYKSWNVTCADDSGNYNTSETRTFRVISGPVAQLISPANGSVTNGINVTLIYNASDGNGIANCSLYLNGVLNQTNTTVNNFWYSNFTLSNLSEGEYTWYLFCTDNDNTTGVSSTYTFYSDQTAPAINLQGPANGATLTTTPQLLNFTLVDTISRNATCNITIDGTVSTTNRNFIAQNGSITSKSETTINGLHWWNVTCYDQAGNYNTSTTWNFTTNVTVPMVVVVDADKNSYQDGEIALVNTTVRNDTNGLTSTNITLDYIYTNRTYTDVPWWNTSWARRMPIYINETLGVARSGRPIRINISFPYNTIKSCTNELRIIDDTTLTPQAYNSIAGDDVSWCEIIFNGTVTASASNQQNYHVYYNNSGATNPGYSNIQQSQLFFNNFAAGTMATNGWTVTSADWDIQAGTPLAGNHAHVDGTGAVTQSNATTTNSVTTSGFDQVNLTWTWMIVTAFDLGEYLRMDLYNGSSWSLQVFSLDGNVNENTLNTTTLTLNSTFQVSSFNIRFRALMNDVAEDAGFDNINLTGYYNISANVTAKAGAEQLWVSRVTNITNTTGRFDTTFNTSGVTLGNYSAVVKAEPNNAKTSFGTGYDWYNVIADTFGPVITVINQANLTTLLPGTITFNFTANDFANSVQNCSVYIIGQQNDTNTTITESAVTNFYFNLTEGMYTWYVQCFDTLTSNTTTPQYTLYIDNSSPNVQAISPNGSTLSNGKIAFTFNATDNFDTSINCTVTVDGNSTLSNSTLAANGTIRNVNISINESGTHWWNVTCIDNINNTGYSATLNFTLADRPDVVLIAPANNSGINSTNVTLLYTLSSANVVNCTLTLNNTVYSIVNATDIPYKVVDGQNQFNLSSMNPGRYNWTVQCYDSNNFNDTDGYYYFHLDDAAPIIAINAPANDDILFSRTVRFNFTVTDVDDTLVCNLTLDGAVNQSNMQIRSTIQNLINVTNVAIGNHSWNVTCFDNVPFNTTSETWNFTIIANSTITLISPANNSVDGDGSIGFQFKPTSTAGFSLGYCSLWVDGVEQNPPVVAPVSDTTYTITKSGMSEGNHSWYIYCFDDASNDIYSPTRNFTVDLTVPTVIIYEPNGTLFNTTSISFNWSATDNYATNMTCTVRVDNISQSPTVTTIAGNVTNYTYSGFNDGIHWWNVTCRDDGYNNGTSGNLNFTTVGYPSITLNYPADNNRTRFSDIQFRFTPTDNSGTIQNCTLILDGLRNETNTTSSASGVAKSITSTGISEGNHSWRINCSDPTGYEGNSTHRNFTIDQIPPDMVMLYPLNGDATPTNDVTFYWNATDYTGTQVTCRLFIDSVFNQSQTLASGSNFSRQALNISEGTHNWSLNCSDDVGNTNVSETFNFTINSADLFINNTRLTINASNPNVGEQIQLRANVTNLGGVPAANVLVEFWDGLPLIGTFIGNATSTVNAGQNVSFNVNWNITTGFHTIWVVVDRYNTITEMNESNNNASINISVVWVNITAPENNTLFNTSSVSVNFTAYDYTGGIINYTIFISGQGAVNINQTVDSVNNQVNLTINEGRRTVTVQATDALGRSRNSTALFVIIDINPPNGTILTPNGTWFNYSAPQINITATDNVDANITYIIWANGSNEATGNISNNTQALVNLTSKPDGLYWLYIQTTDDANNTQNNTLKQIYVDTTQPYITLIGPDNQSNFTAPNMTVFFTTYDNLANFMMCNVTLDGNTYPGINSTNGLMKNYTFAALGEGSHYWNVSCVDQARNLNRSENRMFNIFKAPAVYLVNPPNNNISSNQTQILYFNISDDTGIENCTLILNSQLNETKINSQLTNNATNNFTLTGLNGTYTWAVTCYDNTSLYVQNTSTTRNFSVDIDPPVSNITTANQTWFNTATPTITFNITDNYDLQINYTIFANGVQNINQSVGNGASGSRVLNALTPDGQYNITIQATDDVNNSANSTQKTIYIDTTVPGIILSSPSNDDLYNSTPVQFNFTPTDNLAGWLICNITINGGFSQNNINVSTSALSTVNVSGFTTGTYWWNISCYDIAGNRNTSANRNFTVDVTPPQASITTTNQTWFNTTTPTITFNITDNFDTQINYTISANGIQNINQSVANGTAGSIALNPLTPDGQYNLTIRAIDDAGNIGNSSNRSIYVDTTQPYITLIGPDNNSNFTAPNMTIYFTPYDNLANFILCNITLDGVTYSGINATSGGMKNSSFSSLVEGVHYWNVSCVDQANNLNRSENRMFNIFKAPAVYLISPPVNNLSNYASLNLYFNISDDTGIENCTLILNSQLNETKINSQLTNNATNNFTVTGLNGTYTWAVTCYDNTTNHVQNTSATWNFTIDLDPPQANITTANETWFNTATPTITFNITDNFDTQINYTIFANGIQNINQSVANGTAGTRVLNALTPDGQYNITIQATDDATNSANSTQKTIYIDTTVPGIIMYTPGNGDQFNSTSVQFNFTPSDNLASWLICNLTATGGNSELNMNISSGSLVTINRSNLLSGTYFWNVTCYDIAGNVNTSATRNFTINAPDLLINTGNITFATTSYEEGNNISLYANVYNLGGVTAYNITVQFWLGQPGQSGSAQINGNLTISSLAAGGNYTVNLTTTQTIGTNNIFVEVDPQTAINGTITEENESNNRANRTYIVPLAQIYAGNLTGIIEMEKQSRNLSLYQWQKTNYSGSRIYIADIEANVNFFQLQGLGINRTNGTGTTNDFVDLDNKIGSTNLTDSINRSYTLANQPLSTENMTLYNNLVLNVPVINSSSNITNFKTGILWDASDGGNEYNGTQDAVFISNIEPGALGSRGNYDFEIAVPAYLRNYNSAGTSVAFYVELK